MFSTQTFGRVLLLALVRLPAEAMDARREDCVRRRAAVRVSVSCKRMRSLHPGVVFDDGVRAAGSFVSEELCTP